jgi:hypothetical protein
VSTKRKFFYIPVVASGNRYVVSPIEKEHGASYAELPELDDVLQSFYRSKSAHVEMRRRTFLTQVFTPLDGSDPSYVVADADGFPPEADPEVRTGGAWLSDYARTLSAKLNFSEGLAKDQSAYIPSEFLQPRLNRVDSKTLRFSSSFPWTQLATRKRVVLLGAPGAGKTTCLRWLALDFSRRLAEAPETEIVPMYFQLRDWSTGEDARRAMEGAWLEVSAAPGSDSSEKRLGAGRMLFLLDGLDEVTDKVRPQICKLVLELAGENPELGIVLSTRTASYGGEFRDFAHVNIEPFDRVQIHEWTYKRLYAPNRVLWRRFINHLTEMPEMSELAGNPFMLGLLTHSFARNAQLPKDSSTLIATYLRALLGDWDMVRGIRRSDEHWATPAQLLTILCRSAYWLAGSGKASFSTEEFCTFQEDRFDREIARKFLPTLAEHTGILSNERNRPNQWHFTHQMWVSFLAAYHLVERPDDATRQLRLSGKESIWSDVWYHACGLSQDASPLIQALLSLRSVPDLTKATLMAHAFSQKLQVEPAVASKAGDFILKILERTFDGFEIEPNRLFNAVDDSLWAIRLVKKRKKSKPLAGEPKRANQLVLAIYAARGGLLSQVLKKLAPKHQSLATKALRDAMQVDGYFSISADLPYITIEMKIQSADTTSNRNVPQPPLGP